MKTDIILSGVGGQGILTIAFVLDNAALSRGLHFKQAEVHGMSQRGGAVYSYLRIADRPIFSDLVPEGQGDMILSVEPLEVQRYLNYLAPGGVVISNTAPHKNIPDYPDEGKVLSSLMELPRCVLVDAAAIAAAGRQPKAQNMAMVGAATPFLPFDLADYEPFIRRLFGSKGEALVQGNLAVLRLGWNVGRTVQRLLEEGLPTRRVNSFLLRVTPETVDPERASEVAGALQGPGTEAFLAEALGKVTLDEALARCR